MSTTLLERFSFRRLPFTPEIEPQALFSYESFQQGRLRLEQALHQRGMALVAGEPGSGKTALARALVSRLAPSSYRTLYCPVLNAKNPLRPVVENLLAQLGEKIPFNNVPRGVAVLKEALLLCAEQGQTPVVLLDDAHGLNASAWLALKTLTNYEMDSRMPFCLWFLGARQELLAGLRWSGLAEVRSRLHFCYHLRGLQEAEAEAYLAAHLRWAGCDRPLFPREVALEIHRQAHGLPRMVNRLAQGCLVAAACERKDLVDLPCLEQAASELLQALA